MACADLPSSSNADAAPAMSGLLAGIPADRRAALVGFLGEQSMVRDGRGCARLRSAMSSCFAHSCFFVSVGLFFFSCCRVSARAQASPRLLYRASRDGFKAADFYRACGGQACTLTLIKANDDIRPVDGGYLFGAFTHPAWPAAEPSWEGLTPVQGMLKDIPIADPAAKSFLFSLQNKARRAVKLRLKPGKEAEALVVAQTFGAGWGKGDLRLCTFDRGSQCSTDGSRSYEIDPTQADAAAILAAGVTFDRFFLAGDQDCDYDTTPFYASEIEVWSLL